MKDKIFHKMKAAFSWETLSIEISCSVFNQRFILKKQLFLLALVMLEFDESVACETYFYFTVSEMMMMMMIMNQMMAPLR